MESLQRLPASTAFASHSPVNSVHRYLPSRILAGVTVAPAMKRDPRPHYFQIHIKTF